MSRHLTDEEMDGVLMGAESHALHLQECEVCRAKVVEMRAMMECFRDGLLLWESSSKVKSEILRSAQNDNPEKYSWMALPAMGLAAALVVGLMVPHWMHERSAGAARTANDASRDLGHVASQAANIAPTSQKRDVGHPMQSDDALMQQVQQQLDEDVPSSMTPLTALIQTEEPRADSLKPMRQEKVN